MVSMWSAFVAWFALSVTASGGATSPIGGRQVAGRGCDLLLWLTGWASAYPQRPNSAVPPLAPPLGELSPEGTEGVTTVSGLIA